MTDLHGECSYKRADLTGRFNVDRVLVLNTTPARSFAASTHENPYHSTISASAESNARSGAACT